MAKASSNPTAPANASAVAKLPFALELSDAPAAVTRKIGGESSPFPAVMRAMPLPVNGKFTSFFVPAPAVPATITDADERAKASKDAARKLTNNLSGISRRLSKADKSFQFALRTQEQNGVIGVRVYRIAAAAPVPATEPAAT